jgi:CRP-like cAMP-binding protein
MLMLSFSATAEKGGLSMPENRASEAPCTNRLLAALPDEEYRRLSPHLEQFVLTYGATIYERSELVRHIYFPESGIISLLAALADSTTLEVGMVGPEGMVGLPVFLGVATSTNRAIVQGPGLASRMKVEDFLAQARNGGAWSRVLRRYTHSLLVQVSQSALCYRVHPIEARLARWLLMTADRMAAHEFHITQEFLSYMLGVRREAVNKVAVLMQQQELISYSRGHLAIINRAGLTAVSCQCYGIIRDEERSFPTELRR